MCINQKDDEEKSSQVRKMTDIFDKASRVCIWLGPHENDSSKVIPFLSRILGLNDLDDLVKDRHRFEKVSRYF